jgi:hypothetical protein
VRADWHSGHVLVESVRANVSSSRAQVPLPGRQRGADLRPPGTRAHDGHLQLPGAARHVRGKGARCVRSRQLRKHYS